jgi:hypothetical protein
MAFTATRTLQEPRRAGLGLDGREPALSLSKGRRPYVGLAEAGPGVDIAGVGLAHENKRTHARLFLEAIVDLFGLVLLSSSAGARRLADFHKRSKS